jgi:hypothetical protein
MLIKNLLESRFLSHPSIFTFLETCRNDAKGEIHGRNKNLEQKVISKIPGEGHTTKIRIRANTEKRGGAITGFELQAA